MHGDRAPALPRPVGAILLAAVLAVGCGAPAPSASPTPEPTGRPPAADLEIAIRVDEDPGLQFWPRDVHAMLTDAAGEQLEWIVPDGGARTLVPAGEFELAMWTVVFSDFIQCQTPPAAPVETCFAPELGRGQVCSLPVELVPGGRFSVEFRVRRGDRCQLTAT